MKKVLVSACLAGERVRYDGEAATLHDEVLQEWIAERRAILICPEVSGGLSTPRDPAEIVGGDGHDVLEGSARVITNSGVDVTAQFVAGAEATLRAAQSAGAVVAVLQNRSPSCGSREIYDGTFSKTKKPGAGVTATLLERHGIKVFGRDEIQQADAYLRNTMIDYQSILDFWFDGDEAKWWKKDPEFDQKVREQFGDAIEAAHDGELDDWMNGYESCLAAIILLDQFTRNAFRGTARMFESDVKARAFAKVAIVKGFDLKAHSPLLSEQVRRGFFYMPLMHSEHDDDQAMSIACFERFASESQSDGPKKTLDFAHKHKAIIDQFGRYPHRNEILGRTSTEAEIEFLKGPGSSF